MAVVVCELWWDYDFRADFDEVFLWREKAGIYWRDDFNDNFSDVNDFTDYVILFRDGVFNFGFGEFVDSADFAVCDGVGVFDWSVCGRADSRRGGGVYGDEVARFSYFCGADVCGDEKFFD